MMMGEPSSLTDRQQQQHVLHAYASCRIESYTNNSSVKGFVYFNEHQSKKSSKSEDSVTDIWGKIEGLAPNSLHGFHVHELGDLTQGCVSLGDHYNPFNKTHGSLTSTVRHAGDLGNIQADQNGVARFRFNETSI